MSFWIYNLGLGVPISESSLASPLRLNSLVNTKATREIKNTDSGNRLFEQVSQNPEEKNTKKQDPKLSEYVSLQEKKHPEQVFYAEQIMTSPVKIFSEDLSFSEAWQLFIQFRYRHFPVLNNSTKLVGIVSDRDMLRQAAALKSSQLKTLTINSIMQTQVITATPKTMVRNICEVMFKQHIGAIPITDETGHLLGIVSRSDILRGLIKFGPVELWV